MPMKFSATEDTNNDNGVEQEVLIPLPSQMRSRLSSADVEQEKRSSRLSSADVKQDERSSRLSSADVKQDERSSRLSSADVKQDERSSRLSSADVKQDESILLAWGISLGNTGVNNIYMTSIEESIRSIDESIKATDALDETIKQLGIKYTDEENRIVTKFRSAVLSTRERAKQALAALADTVEGVNVSKLVAIEVAALSAEAARATYTFVEVNEHAPSASGDASLDNSWKVKRKEASSRITPAYTRTLKAVEQLSQAEVFCLDKNNTVADGFSKFIGSTYTPILLGATLALSAILTSLWPMVAFVALYTVVRTLVKPLMNYLENKKSITCAESDQTKNLMNPHEALDRAESALQSDFTIEMSRELCSNSSSNFWSPPKPEQVDDLVAATDADEVSMATGFARV
jgi:hypothetical protein